MLKIKQVISWKVNKKVEEERKKVKKEARYRIKGKYVCNGHILQNLINAKERIVILLFIFFPSNLVLELC